MSDNAKQPVRRALRILFVLQGHSFEGLRLKQVADAVRATPSTVLRDLEVLLDEGIVERIPGRDEYWRLSPRLVQIAVAHQEETRRLQQRLEEFNQRYTRQPS
ncbi:helix-turn-helix domain-containing protein [Pseudoxanthomonas sp. 22568]|uniref:helix-turn-helix domain-containing protein n=1 Tax=Pseudoxanthomonas sp. 22568 TaxID=3453945 RepID=UPI003F86B27D